MTREFVLPSEAGLYRDPKVVFGGWYTDTAYGTAYDFSAPVTGGLDLYARWTEPSPVDLSGQGGDHLLAKALNYIAGQSLSEETPYTVVLAGNYSMAGVSAANITTANAVITLAGASPTELSLSSNGALFSITAGELVLGNNITLTGLSSNDLSLVMINGSSASLTMKAGAKISGNSAPLFGGGVYVGNASFTMEGGEISGNSASYFGGGVFVGSSSSFSKTGGVIYGDTDGTHTAGSTENTATYGTTYGHAVDYYYDAGSSAYYYRDDTLNAGDNISTGDALPANPGDSLNNWTKR
jgi:hypothetical protein